MRKVWIEAALNGPWSRSRQPGIPDTVDAIIADGLDCAAAGACIVHVHAYDGGGPQTFDWQVYARIIEGIRTKIDVPVYPSIPSAGIGVGPLPADAAARFAHVEALAARGLLEFAVVDPGSVNFTELSIGPDASRADLSQSRSTRAPCVGFCRPLWLSPGLCHLRAGLYALRGSSCTCDRCQDADLPADVFRDVRLWLSAQAVCSRRPCGAARG